MSYDANGNLTGDGTATYSWDVENRMVGRSAGSYPQTVNSTFWHDPWGRRVNQTVYDKRGETEVDTHEYYFYGITGQRLMTVGCSYGQDGTPTCAVIGQNVYFGRKLLVSNGVTVVTDRLGSVRANGQGERFSYYPYGEERTATVDGREKFGTYFRDLASGMDYADQRYYGNGMGRFWSVDPGGIATATLSRPASLNRYAYTEGDPVNFADPHGMFTCWADPPPEHPEWGCVWVGDSASADTGPPCNPYTRRDNGCIQPGGGVGPLPPTNWARFAAAYSNALNALSHTDCSTIFGTAPSWYSLLGPNPGTTPADVLKISLHKW